MFIATFVGLVPGVQSHVQGAHTHTPKTLLFQPTPGPHLTSCGHGHRNNRQAMLIASIENGWDQCAAWAQLELRQHVARGRDPEQLSHRWAVAQLWFHLPDGTLSTDSGQSQRCVIGPGATRGAEVAVPPSFWSHCPGKVIVHCHHHYVLHRGGIYLAACAACYPNILLRAPRTLTYWRFSPQLKPQRGRPRGPRLLVTQTERQSSPPGAGLTRGPCA